MALVPIPLRRKLEQEGSVVATLGKVINAVGLDDSIGSRHRCILVHLFRLVQPLFRP
jgi:hypothetical protein